MYFVSQTSDSRTSKNWSTEATDKIKNITTVTASFNGKILTLLGSVPHPLPHHLGDLNLGSEFVRCD